MDITFLSVLKIVGALGLFIYGMKVMSEAIQKAAGQRLRDVLNAMTANKTVAISSGTFVTAILQSSSATTVLLISFVNAGLISVKQAISAIMGANIGTTLTAWLVAMLGLGKFSISALSLPILAVSLPLIFIKSEKARLWGHVLVGFALLFLGLSFIKESVPDLSANPEIFDFFRTFSYSESSFILRFFIVVATVIIGMVVTIIVQSSSAAMALTLVLCYEGWISFPLAAALVLGENIGTTITANIAALVGNVYAKRAARAHFWFNVLGAIWAILLFPVLLKVTAQIAVYITGTNPFVSATAIPIALAVFHTFFNIANTLIFVGLTDYLARLVEWLVPSRSSEDEVFGLDFIESGLMDTPELSIIEARKELLLFANMIKRGFRYIPLLITEMDEDKFLKHTQRLEEHEDRADKLKIEITNYLNKLSKSDLSYLSSAKVRSFISIANYLERIGDVYLIISRNLTVRKEKKAYFTQDTRDRVKKLSAKVDKSLELMVYNIEMDREPQHYQAAADLENEIDDLYHSLRNEYLDRMESGKVRPQSGMYYNDLIAELERIADYAASVSEALAESRGFTTQEQK